MSVTTKLLTVHLRYDGKSYDLPFEDRLEVLRRAHPTVQQDDVRATTLLVVAETCAFDDHGPAREPQR